MAVREKIARYRLIIKRLQNRPASFREVLDYLSRKSEPQEYDFNFSKHTFQRDVKEILSLYGIEIAHDSIQRVYKK